MNSILQPPMPKDHEQRTHWHNLIGSSLSLAITSFAAKGLKLIITPNLLIASQLADEIAFFEPEASVRLFPDWEVLPYDHFSPHEDILSQRLGLLSQLPNVKHGYVIAAASTLLHRLTPTEHIAGQSFELQLGDILDLNAIKSQLISSGYRHVEQVWQHGEFAVRGAILDIFPMGHHTPFRIELSDNNIESLRTFDVETQRTISKVSEIKLLPGHEYPLTDEGITCFRQNWREQFSGNPKECPIYNSVSEGRTIAGIEFYLPLFFDHSSDFFEYLPADTMVFIVQDIHHATQQFTTECKARYEQYRHDRERPILEPKQLYLDVNEFFLKLKRHQQIHLHSRLTDQTAHHFNCQPLPELTVNRKLQQPLSLLRNFIQQTTIPTIICAQSSGRQEVLHNLLLQHNLSPCCQPDWKTTLEQAVPLSLITAPLQQGFCFSEQFNLISETELFGATARLAKRSSSQQDPNTIIKNLVELSIGSPVVHIQHGVGRYLGLTTLTTGDITAEYLTLEYANHDRVYVPIASLQLVSRYTGADCDNAPLHRLGSQRWQHAKDKASKRIRDVAAELLQIYSQRAASQGFAFKAVDEDFKRFRQEFLFEETPDQSAAINAVIEDMTHDTSMDRLICGDVGFGKTEVAMQAAFMAINSNKQVAILVPTTLLANQHYQNFCDRFASWPVKIAALSRMQNAKEQQYTLQRLQQGHIDIVIGTHKLLQPTIIFKDLGLLVIDEEHRFGVRHKERIKKLRSNVDILTLTATPIPRTLNMALSNTRDLSIIATPPQRRLSIKTFVYKRHDAIMQEAIAREVMRGGQVYFLHNNVATMPAQQEHLKSLCPGIKINMAHGQMREKQLEAVMSDFYHQKFQVLIASTIIESGIDIPSANTIIINRADKFGLAQLHQLRGRVGRSHHQAYAYLLLPAEGEITRDAQKRLDAITSLEDLGAGFTLATHDLEIRGAGELLGEDQSGQIHAIGFSLYMEMLDQAVQALRHGKEPDYRLTQEQLVEVELHVSTLFPENYIHDVNTRLSLYKRLASCVSKVDIEALTVEIIDRFGPLPEQAHNLIIASELRLYAEKLGIKKLECHKKFIYLHFTDQPTIDPGNIIRLIQSKPQHYQLQKQHILRVSDNSSDVRQRQANLIQLFKQLSS